MENPEPDAQARIHMKVRGRVQGVGFRAHVEFAARQLGVNGWVRNVGYDTVEVMAEAKHAVLERLAEAVRAGPRGSHVDESTVDWLDASGEFQGFTVRRSV